MQHWKSWITNRWTLCCTPVLATSDRFDGDGFIIGVCCIGCLCEWFCCCRCCCCIGIDWHYNIDDAAIDSLFILRRFFFFAVRLSWPLSVFESLSSESLELELDDEDELELLELSDAKPVLSSIFIWVASAASAGSLFYCSSKSIIKRIRKYKIYWFPHINYRLFGKAQIVFQYIQPNILKVLCAEFEWLCLQTECLKWTYL